MPKQGSKTRAYSFAKRKQAEGDENYNHVNVDIVLEPLMRNLSLSVPGGDLDNLYEQVSGHLRTATGQVRPDAFTLYLYQEQDKKVSPLSADTLKSNNNITVYVDLHPYYVYNASHKRFENIQNLFEVIVSGASPPSLRAFSTQLTRADFNREFPVMPHSVEVSLCLSILHRTVRDWVDIYYEHNARVIRNQVKQFPHYPRSNSRMIIELLWYTSQVHNLGAEYLEFLLSYCYFTDKMAFADNFRWLISAILSEEQLDTIYEDLYRVLHTFALMTNDPRVLVQFRREDLKFDLDNEIIQPVLNLLSVPDDQETMTRLVVKHEYDKMDYDNQFRLFVGLIILRDKISDTRKDLLTIFPPYSSEDLRRILPHHVGNPKITVSLLENRPGLNLLLRLALLDGNQVSRFRKLLREGASFTAPDENGESVLSLLCNMVEDEHFFSNSDSKLADYVEAIVRDPRFDRAAHRCLSAEKQQLLQRIVDEVDQENMLDARHFEQYADNLATRSTASRRVDSLPVDVDSTQVYPSNLEADWECPICAETDQNDLVWTVPCGHGPFHNRRGCLLETGTQCPMCRGNITSVTTYRNKPEVAFGRKKKRKSAKKTRKSLKKVKSVRKQSSRRQVASKRSKLRTKKVSPKGRKIVKSHKRTVRKSRK